MKQEKVFKFVGDTLMLPGEERQYNADKKIRANKRHRLHKKTPYSKGQDKCFYFAKLQGN